MQSRTTEEHEATRRLHLNPRRFSTLPLAIESGLYIGPEIDRLGIQELARAGFRSILDLAHEGEEGQGLSPNVAATWAHTFELVHERLSIDLSPSAAQFEGLCRLLDGLPRPIYVQSMSGERARTLGIAYVALRKGWSAERALDAAEPRSDSLKHFLVETLADTGRERRDLVAEPPRAPTRLPGARR